MKISLNELIAIALLLVMPGFLSANNKPGKDFLITLNGSKLTGNIKFISISNGKSQISFENDFGDTYAIHPATIFGFAFMDGDETYLYESKNLNGGWQFLKVEKKGAGLCLYTSSERQLKFSNLSEVPIVVKVKNPQIWLQFAGEQPIKVYRYSYKGVLRIKMESYPELAKMVGKRGFKYNNLPMMVELYNRFYSKSNHHQG